VRSRSRSGSSREIRGDARVSSWKRERFLARQRLAGERGAQRAPRRSRSRSRCLRGCAGAETLPRRVAVRCPAHAVRGGRKPPSHRERRESFPQLSKSAVPEPAPDPRDLAESLSLLSMLSHLAGGRHPLFSLDRSPHVTARL